MQILMNLDGECAENQRRRNNFNEEEYMSLGLLAGLDIHMTLYRM